MNEAVPRIEAAVVNVLPAANRNNRSRTTIRIKLSGALGNKTKQILPITEVTPPKEVSRRIWSIGWVSTILAPTPQKKANVVIVKIMRPKIVKPAANVGAWDNFGVIAAVGPHL